MPSVSPAPTATDLRNTRRDIVAGGMGRMRMGFIVISLREPLRRFFDRGADAYVRRATACIAGHRVVDVLVGGPLVLREECGGCHHLSRLAVTALRHVELFPCRLHGLAFARGQPFD